MFDSNNKSREEARVRVGDFILAIALVVATAANFTEFDFSFSVVSKFTAVSLLIYIVTTLTYNHMFNRGKIEGRLDKGYIDAVNEFNEERDKMIKCNSAGRLAEFIDYYKKKELKEYRENVLSQFNITYEYYEKNYLGVSLGGIMKLKIPFSQKMAIIKCNRAKHVILTPAYFTSNDLKSYKRRNSIGISGSRSESRDKIFQALKRLPMALFSGAIGVDLVFNFSWETVIQWAMRMLPIFVALITGAGNGYRNITEDETSYKKNQVFMIRLFIDWTQSTP